MVTRVPVSRNRKADAPVTFQNESIEQLLTDAGGLDFKAPGATRPRRISFQ